MNSLTPKQMATIDITIDENPYIPHEPFYKQIQFLTNESEDVLYGGQAGWR
jgi:hypothetical protein